MKVYLIPALTVLLLSCGGSKQAKQSNTGQVTDAVSADRWVFNARYANPQTGRSRFLNSPEFIKISRDTIESSLPYFGRAFSGADLFNNQSVLVFRSTKFNYVKEKNSKGGWMVTITPGDNPQVQSLVFELFDNGSGSLNVTLTNRSPISFTGTVMPR